MARRLSFLVVLAALFAGGCGQSEKDKLIAQADPICKQVNERRAAANAALGNVTNLSGKGTLAAVARSAPALAANQHEAVAKLTALKAPSSVSKDWGTMLSGLQQLANYTAQLGLVAGAKKPQIGEKLIATSRQLQKKLIALAKQDGFQHCGRLN
ncbi:MAG TPA: hypothetical protein VFY36_08415 [Solirubrobacteraceae bacterium]|nr:hypothetical protein [Solirubrobacteraceae bacterium]